MRVCVLMCLRVCVCVRSDDGDADLNTVCLLVCTLLSCSVLFCSALFCTVLFRIGEQPDGDSDDDGDSDNDGGSDDDSDGDFV